MSEQELQAIKEQLANIPEGWMISEGARIIKGLKVSGDYLAAEVEFLHVQRDSQSKIIEEVRAENERLRKALEKIAYTSAIKELYEAEAFADRVLRGEST
ncbi:hypothetical protein NSQ62_14520 [Solibacillus sp. FSL H8-0523]|uniref:hypothetical protein n=1 Tax=Solibacillus sp. FSL H8-0523 TaxID=2954511 RepID=UPI0031015FAE